jgi:hypothetical protein
MDEWDQAESDSGVVYSAVVGVYFEDIGKFQSNCKNQFGSPADEEENDDKDQHLDDLLNA